MAASAAFTTRAGGTSRPPYAEHNLAVHVGDDVASVGENRALAAALVGAPPGGVVWMEQVHGSAVAVVDRPRAEPVAGTDALVTATPGIALAVLVADCVPLLLVDDEHGVVAAVHAGRRGAAAGVALRALEVMRDLGAEPATTEALLGPSVCGGCYAVPAAMRDEVAAALPAAAAQTRDAAPALDLAAGLAEQLRAAGLARVVRDERCTAESPDLFSHRRDGQTGRQAGLVWLS